ncbi:MAG: GIY-YIG nuclease family protein [Salinivirgaceae bacterium]|nr:GIY-YIG nuclease family protein [Salinivirgaceae bacterium]
MERGIIYIMSTAVEGLIKIGKTDNFEQRMGYLEKHGYCNVTGLKRQFAIEVDNYSKKEDLLKNIFIKSRLGRNSELFSIDLNLAKQLLSAFEGTIIFPKESKEELFEEATTAFKNAEEFVLENAIEDKEFSKEFFRAKDRHHFKDIEFTSSLTGKKYKGTTNKETGNLMIIDIESGEEIPNYSKPSKMAIVQQAVKDIGEEPKDTLYLAYRQLMKLIK